MAGLLDQGLKRITGEADFAKECKTFAAALFERQGRLIDYDETALMEQKNVRDISVLRL